MSEFNSNQLNKCKNEILQGLNELHYNNISHGDIKPSYIGYDKFNDRYFLLENTKSE